MREVEAVERGGGAAHDPDRAAVPLSEQRDVVAPVLGDERSTTACEHALRFKRSERQARWGCIVWMCARASKERTGE